MNVTRLKTWSFAALFILCTSFAATAVFSAQGDADGYFKKAENYQKGENGVAKNVEEAKKWYLKAAEAGHAGAQGVVGQNYYFGDNGFPQDREKAVTWLEKAARTGVVAAQATLFMYFSNDAPETKRDRQQATYYHDQVLQNDRDGWPTLAMTNYILFKAGSDSPWISQQELQKHFLLAAEKGSPLAQIELADFYENGLRWYKLFEQDRGASISWLKKAAVQGHDIAKETLRNRYGVTVYDKDAPGSQPETLPCPQATLQLVPNEDKLAPGTIVNDYGENKIKIPGMFYNDYSSPKYFTGEAECTYETSVRITLRWENFKNPHDDLAVFSCTVPRKRCPPVESINTSADRLGFDLNSCESLASVGVILSKQEFEQTQRQKWVNIAKQLLPLVEERATSCQGNTKQDTPLLPKTSATTGQYRSQGKKSPKPGTPAASDSWDAPSPKAKIPN